MFRILAMTAALFGAIATAHADVYRWVDANGTVQYSDRWVPGSVLVKTAVPRGSSVDASTPAAPASAADATATDSQQQQSQQTVQQDVAKTREEQCKKAKADYQSAIEHPRLYRTLPNGEREYVSDAEADAYRVELLNRRKEFCGS